VAVKPSHPLLQHLFRRVAPSAGGEETDGRLLQRFLAHRDEAAFAALVQRHGPMVLGVCRRVLDEASDVEDAFQATFLVHKAGSVRRRESIGSFLYGVALRVARRARARAASRRAHERRAPIMPPEDDPRAAVIWRDLRPVLDEELGRLPEKYRAPLVLCYLEGKTHEEAARQLGWTNGTVCGRLARARDLLRARLVRRGLTLSAAALPAALAEGTLSAAVPASLAAATLRAALLYPAAGVSAPVVALTKETVNAMFRTKIKVVSLALALVVLAGGAGVVAHEVLAGKPPPADDGRREGPAPAARAELPGDPLPPGAVARLGTARFRNGARVASVVFSPDGKTLAATGDDGAVTLWEVPAGKLLRAFGQSTSPSAGICQKALAFSPGGILRTRHGPCQGGGDLGGLPGPQPGGDGRHARRQRGKDAYVPGAVEGLAQGASGLGWIHACGQT
jgi:RNA polymerase sigma factor (sigma-70 family)